MRATTTDRNTEARDRARRLFATDTVDATRGARRTAWRAVATIADAIHPGWFRDLFARDGAQTRDEVIAHALNAGYDFARGLCCTTAEERDECYPVAKRAALLHAVATLDEISRGAL